MLEAGWGLLFTVLVAGAFLAVVIWPRRCTPPLVQVGVVVVALAIAAAVGAGAGLVLVAVSLAVGLLVLLGMLPKDREPLWPPAGQHLLAAGRPHGRGSRRVAVVRDEHVDARLSAVGDDR